MEGPVSIGAADNEGSSGTADMDKSTENKADELPTHFLVRADPLDGLMQPVQASARIKYVCLTVSERCVAMGTNTGVVYIFSRISQRRIHVIPGETDGTVVQITLNGQGNLLAYATGKGHVMICRLFPNAGGHPTRLRCATEHVGSTVTAMQWNHNSDQLFIGDDLGRISVVNFFTLTNNALGSLGPPSEVILRLDSAVVQVDSRGEQLLVSTKTKTVLCDVKKHQFSQIGKRPRDGKFGACFFGAGTEEAAVIYCSRPGSRMWQVDHEGVVLNTHQFKQLLNKPPTPVLSLRDWSPVDFVSRSSHGPQSLAFPKLLLLGDHYLLFFCPKGLYILDPVNVGLLNWTDQVTDAVDVCCYKSEVYVLRQSGDIQKMELLSVRELWTCLVSRQQWDLATWLVINFPSLTECQDSAYSIALPLLKELSNKITESDTRTSLISIIKGLETEGAITTLDTKEPGYDRLDSGIYKMRTQNIETKLLHSSKNEACLENAEKTSIKNSSLSSPKMGDLANGHDVSRVIGDDQGEEAQIDYGPSCGHNTVTAIVSEENDEAASNSFMHDPAPIYPASCETRKVKGRKIKPASVGLSPSRKKAGDKDKKSKKSKSHAHVLTTNLAQHTEVLNECTVDKCTVNEEEHSPAIAEEPSLETVPEHDCTSGGGNPVIHEELIDGLEAKLHLANVGEPETPAQCEDLSNKDTPGHINHIDASSTTAPDTRGDADDKTMPSTKVNLYSVRERISSKVKSTTLSMIQNIKDRKVLLTRMVSSPENKDGSGTETGLPVIDVKDLVLATENCKTKMDDPHILYRPDVAKAALTSWAVMLNQTLHTLLIANQDREESMPDEKTEKLDDNTTKTNQKLEYSIQEKSCIDKKLVADTSSDLLEDDSKNICSETASHVGHEFGPRNVVSIEGVSLEGHFDSNSDAGTVQPLCPDYEASLSVDEHTYSPANTTSEVFHDVRQFEKLMFTQDPFNLPADCHQVASELAQLCLSFSCYGGTSEPISPNRDLPECDIQNAQNDLNCNDIDSTTRKANQTYLASDCAGEDQCTEDKGRDELSIFLRCHFNLFTGNLDETHRAVLRPCNYRFERWKSFVTCLLDLTAEDVVTRQIMDTDVEAAIAFLRSQVSQRGIWVLASILRLYGMVPQRTLAFCAEIWEHVPPIDVFFMTKMASKIDPHFLMYAKRVLDKDTNSKWTQALQGVCQDEEVRQGLVCNLLQARPEIAIPLSCPCGLPWPGAHLLGWPCKDLLHLILDQGSCGVVERQLCWRHGFWPGVVKLCHQEINCTACREEHCDVHMVKPCNVRGDVHKGRRAKSWDIHIEGSHTDINRNPHVPLMTDKDINAESDGQRDTLMDPHGGKDWNMNRDTLQTIVLQLADINLLQQDTESGYFPRSVTEWEELLRKRSAQGYGKSSEAECIDNSVLCLGCSRSLVIDSTIILKPNTSIAERHNSDSNIPDIALRSTYVEDNTVCSWRPDVTWEALAAMLVKEVGLSRGLGVLQGVGVHQGQLSMAFFSSCVMAATLQNHQSRLVHNMLERVDTYLWSVRPTTMAPEVSMAILQENSDSGHTTSTDKMFENLRSEPIISSSLEDATAGWGVAVDLTGNCAVCTLPLKTMVSPLYTGTIFFKCGHGSHYACSSKTSCTTCSSLHPVLLP